MDVDTEFESPAPVAPPGSELVINLEGFEGPGYAADALQSECDREARQNNTDYTDWIATRSNGHGLHGKQDCLRSAQGYAPACR